jgi:hypothetical protein
VVVELIEVDRATAALAAEEADDECEAAEAALRRLELRSAATEAQLREAATDVRPTLTSDLACLDSDSLFLPRTRTRSAWLGQAETRAAGAVAAAQEAEAQALAAQQAAEEQAREAGAAVRKMESAQRAAVRARTVSRHDVAGIWVAFFSRCQRYRC